jgi:hypothetical protein
VQEPAIAEAGRPWQADGSAATVRQGGVALVQQLPHAPETLTAERVVEERRRAMGGEVYASIEESMAAVAREVTALAADPERGRRLAGWSWIWATWAALPPPAPPATGE